ncbi:MAG: protein-tyrosine phosphatase family protein [Solirubrobacteraceae bacterium]
MTRRFRDQAAMPVREQRSFAAVSRWFHQYGFADVHDQLLVGAYPLDPGDVDTLAHMGVTRVLNLAEDAEYPPGARPEVQAAFARAAIAEYRVPFGDFGSLPQEPLERAVSLVESWLRDEGLVYVHCRAGRQRSAAVAAGAVAALEGLAIDDALALVRRRKPTAEPLPHQVDDLRTWWAQRNGLGSLHPADG